MKDRLEGFPWVVAANRDEAYARPSSPPGPVRGPFRVFCGVDLQSGGTWLGVNEQGLISAITNRPGGDDSGARPSRGQVPLGALLQPDKASAAAFLLDLQHDRTPWRIQATPEDRDRHVTEAPPRDASGPGYNPFNLFVAQGGSGSIAYAHKGLHWQDVSPGVHVLTNHHDLDRLEAEEITSRIGPDRVWGSAERGELVETLKGILGHHEGLGPEKYPVCKHGDEYGTVSSTILAVGEDFPKDALFLHAEGSPCKTPFVDYTPALRSAFA